MRTFININNMSGGRKAEVVTAYVRGGGCLGVGTCEGPSRYETHAWVDGPDGRTVAIYEVFRSADEERKAVSDHRRVVRELKAGKLVFSPLVTGLKAYLKPVRRRPPTMTMTIRVIVGCDISPRGRRGQIAF